MIEVRSATIDDAVAIGAAHAASWRRAYVDLGPDFLASIVDAERAELWAKVLGGDGSDAVFVAEDDGRVVAFVNVRSSRDEGASPSMGEVVALYAAPDVWGRGAGRALLATAVDELAARGFSDATLWVLASNARARRFYEIAGWLADGAEKVQLWRGVSVHEVRYRRSI